MPSGLLVGALRARRSLKLLAFSAGEAGLLGACSVTQTRSWTVAMSSLEPPPTGSSTDSTRPNIDEPT
jgi:hypothetical protein